MCWSAWWFVCACLSLTAVGRGEDLPSAVISQGGLSGTFLETRGGRKISAFLGIPYARPPLGLLRFHKPLPAEPWEGVRNTSVPGSPCLQASLFGKGAVSGNEDCLFLNVYTHKVLNEPKYPVLVFIHGGAFTEGSADRYQPNFLMDKDIVLVTINYRLGPLGFFTMEDKELSGNFGLKDQTLALKWVQKNIAQFGGNAGSVTIFGESAGAASVHYHMISPLSKGLFHRAISTSGTSYCPWATQERGKLRVVGERFASQLGCNHFTVNDTLTCLRDIPAYVMVDLAYNLYEWNYDPVVLFPPAIEPEDAEDAFLTEDPWKLSSEIPWIAGLTNAEGRIKVAKLSKRNIIELNDDFEMIGPLTLLFRTTAEDPIHTAFAIKKYYFFDGDLKPDNLEELTRMYTDSWFMYPVKEAFRRHRGPKYFFYLDYRGANSMVPDYHGVSHFDDMQYFFPMEPFFKQVNITAEDQRMSDRLLELWTNFITHGTPTLESSDTAWTSCDKENMTNQYLHIKKSGFVMETDLLKERDDFWKALPYREKYLSCVDNSMFKKDEL